MTGPAPDPARLVPGATVEPEGTRFVVWAPRASTTVELVLDDRRVPLTPVAVADPGDAGSWSTLVPGVGHGTRYRYSLDGSAPLPDPASGWQPDGVHGPSAVVDVGRFTWSDAEWRGRDLVGAVLYELHVGAFTPDGTFDAAIGQLARLAALGVTTIELMPIGAFPGRRNWGYDGVLPWAVQHTYGGPDGLARFVDAAHHHGLAVILDVVDNHLGPEGNVLAHYGPYFTDAWSTPWGPAINVADAGSDGVREYFVEQVVRWIRDFHVDGFRFDAIHAVPDPTANPFWEQLTRVARDAAAAARRRIVLIAETADNDPRHLHPAERNGFGFDAVWCDDVHHTLRVATTGDRGGWYGDYAGTAAELADVIGHRWKFRGQHSGFRGRRHGRPVDEIAPHRFVVCSQNHDQVGNRPAGERPDHHVGAAGRRCLAAAILLSPATPMLFMGEEYGELQPFPFFVDHTDPDILRATNEGRRAEFADSDWSGDVPEPGALGTFRSAILDPTIVERDPRARRLAAMYAELLGLRRSVRPIAAPGARQRVEAIGDVVRIERSLAGTTSSVLVHLGDGRPTVDAPGAVAFSSDAVAWGGDGSLAAADGAVTLPAWSVALVVAGDG